MATSPHISLPFEQNHAFIIGINDYVHISPLKTAVNDARKIAELLESQHDYSSTHLCLNPSKEELLTLFTDTIPHVVGPEDRVCVYIASHGIAIDSDEGPNGYIVPVDAKQGETESLVSMQVIHQALDQLSCQHGLLILDCCFAGAFKWSLGYRDILMDVPNILYEERFMRYAQAPAWQVITSAAFDQKALDVLEQRSLGMRMSGNTQHSPFAFALFQGLKGDADVIPSDKGDGVITATELYLYLRDQVETLSGQHSTQHQSPSLFQLARHDKGEYFFFHPHHPLNLPPTPDRNPFMGLAAYEEADTSFFFGRTEVIADLVKQVHVQPLTVVTGASGTGKSSLIKAGLLPELGNQGWTVAASIRPGKYPMEALKKENPAIESSLSQQDKTLLYIDQYEELITQGIEDAAYRQFEQQLADWLSQYPNLLLIPDSVGFFFH